MAYTGDYGISTLGITLSCGLGTMSTAPSSFKQLNRINSIGGITAEPEVIDASALEDDVTHNIKGRDTISDSVAIVVNLTTDTLKEWTGTGGVLPTYEGKTSGQVMWWQVHYDGKLTDGASSSPTNQSFFFVGEPPSTFPMPESNQNELQTVEIPITVQDVKGYLDEVTPS